MADAQTIQFDEYLRLVKRADANGLRKMIRSGWDVNDGGAGNWQLPLLWVRGNMTFIDLLLEAGADVNPAVIFDMSPLAVAGNEGRVRAVRKLLFAGARVDVQPYGCSLLTYVATGEGRNHPTVFNLLNDAGATVFHGNTHLKEYPPGFGRVG